MATSHDKAFVSALRRHVETELEGWGLDGEVLADYAVAVCEQMSLGDTSKSEAALEARESLETYLTAVYEETDRIGAFVDQIIKLWLGECDPPWGNATLDPEPSAPTTLATNDTTQPLTEGIGSICLDDTSSPPEEVWDETEEGDQWDVPVEQMTDPKTFLHSLFPDRDLTTLNDILATCDGNLERAIAHVLEATSTNENDSLYLSPPFVPPTPDATDASSEIYAPPAPSGVPVCRYFMQGQCFRADCHFSHDLSSTTCRYWLSGGCVKGDQCEFLHSYDPKRLANHQQKRSSQPDTPRKPSSREEEFPQLGSFTPTVPTTPAPPKQGERVDVWRRNTDMATWVKQKRLQELFPTLPLESIQEVLSSRQGSYSHALIWLQGCYPNACQPPAQSVPANMQSKTTFTPRLDRANDSGITQWAETGKVVTRAYREVREEAIHHAKCRNKLFEAATQAYVRGDKAAARELSRQGRYHQDMMTQLHTEAALSIFSNRNLKNISDSAKVIDLHGLHVKEALDVLAHILAHGEESGWGYMYVITGTGHHSVQGRARLLPAVQKYLQDEGYQYADCSTDKRMGMLKVKLRT